MPQPLSTLSRPGLPPFDWGRLLPTQMWRRVLIFLPMANSAILILPLALSLWMICCASAGDARKEAPPHAQDGATKSAGVPSPEQDRGARSAARTKLDSHIVLALKKSRGEPPFDKPTRLDPDLVIEADGQVVVDITATVTKGLLAEIEACGGKVLNSFEAMHAIRARAPLSRLEALAARPDIQFIAPATQASTNSGNAVKP